MDPNLKDKRALVTGAGSGIGRALTLKLLSLGCNVVAVSKDRSKLMTLLEEYGKGGSQLAIVDVDLANWQETNDKLASFCKDIDFLINNAGYAHNTLVENLEEAEVQKTFDINLKAPLNLIRMVAPGMKQRRSGAIVNVSSVSGMAALNEQSIYGATKAGLDMVTKVTAKELGPFNVRVNSVNPTVVWTDMGRNCWPDEKKGEMLSKIPMNRFVDVSEVVNPIIFLLKPDASMINGIMFPIDGGFVAC